MPHRPPPPLPTAGRKLALLLSLASALPTSACSSSWSSPVDLSQPPAVDVEASPPQLLSAYNLFLWDGHSFTFNEGVIPYDLNTPLFTDYALKQRAIYLPPGASATFDPTNALDFPVGTVLIKNFYFAADMRAPDRDLRLIETRLLLHTSSGWEAWPYLWDERGHDAQLAPGGDVLAIDFVDEYGDPQTSNYVVPQRNQCQQCHLLKDDLGNRYITPIGPKARHINRDYDYGGTVGVQNQLEYLASLGMLTGLPDIGTVEQDTYFPSIEADGDSGLSPAEIEKAARDYLDINCAHCHNPNGVQGITSQLFLNYDNDVAFNLGVCKHPGSAGNGTGGLEFDIVPGDPDQSILVFRIETEEVGAMMPLLGRSLTHVAGVQVVRDWIAAMPPVDCSTAVLP